MPIFDIHAAKNAGVYSAGISTGYHTLQRLKDENPDALLESLTGLKYREFL